MTSRSDVVDPVETLYRQLAPAYDLVYGLVLQPGRRAAIRRMNLQPGERVLEVGVGTGLSAVLYPRGCDVVAIDFSPEMLARARARLRRRDIDHVTLTQADATTLQFDDDSFDVVYAPYVINVVRDPIAVAREMRRVCRPGGRIVFLNHFRADGPLRGRVHDLLDRVRNEGDQAIDGERICQGPLLSRAQYLIDIERRGYEDARLMPRGKMSTGDIARWTAGIAVDGAR